MPLEGEGTGERGLSAKRPQLVLLSKVRTFRAHLAKGCAPSKESSGFSKVRTFRKGCASSNNVRIFGRASALGYPLAGAVPFSRKVAPARTSASIASFSTARRPNSRFGVPCPTALRGHAKRLDTRRHAHAEPLGMAHRKRLTA